MLTRSQVAKRLGKSVATVRRIEGVLLAPVQDARGVYRFNADDVDDLARDIARGEVSIWEEIGAAADDRASRLVSGAEPRPSRTADLDLVNTAELRRQSEAAAEQVAKLQRENRELLSFAQQLSRLVVEISSRAQLRALPPETVAVLIALAEAE
jgi:archaellum component FlaD/FlaE